MTDLRPIRKAIDNLWKGIRIFDDASLVNEIAAFETFKEFLVARIGNVCTGSVIETLSTGSDHLKACSIATLALRHAMDIRVNFVTDKELEYAINIMISNEKLMGL